MPLNQSKIYSINIDFIEELRNIKKEKQYTIPIFIPHLACKNECVFCNQRRISGKISIPDESIIDKNIRESLEFLKDKRNIKVQIAFFGGSFTGLNIKEQEKYLKIAYKYVKTGEVDSIRLSTRPDYITPNILRMLKRYNVKNIELGVQSMDNTVLKASKRGHTSLDVIRAARLLKLYGFKLGFQIMIGLPESNIEKECKSTEQLIKLKADEFRIYPVYVIEDTELYQMYLDKRYAALEFEDAVYRTYRVLKLLNKTDIKVIRIGLQSTDEITQNSTKIYGPVSDNFAEYVIAKLLLDKIEYILREKIKDIEENSDIKIVVKKVVPISMVIGPKRCNIEYLESKYNKKIHVESVDK